LLSLLVILSYLLRVSFAGKFSAELTTLCRSLVLLSYFCAVCLDCWLAIVYHLHDH
jgi:hypothetical protein